MNKPKVILIGGPTAVGKTKTSIELAKRLGGEIISADSMQIYKYMDIGSAKPSIEEREGIPHHLLDFVDPREPFSAADFKRLAEAAIEDIHSRGKISIVVGGTGLYMNALLYEMDFSEVTDDSEERKALKAFAETEGNEALHDKLKALDSEAAERIHPNNVKRVIRAIEVASNAEKGVQDFKTALIPNERYDFYLMGLTGDRAKLYDRINRRVLLMFDQGLIDELKFLKNLGLDDSFTSMKGIGYKEIFPYLEGLKPLEQVVTDIQQNSRNYAKRQLTWFRRYPDLKWYDVDAWQDLGTLIEIIEKEIRAHYNI